MIILYFLNSVFGVLNSSQNSEPQMLAFNLTLNIKNIPFLAQMHTHSTANSTLSVAYRLTNFSEATRKALLDHFFSDKQKDKFCVIARIKNPELSDEELLKSFQERQNAIIAKATDPANFASIESSARSALSHKFINDSTINTAISITHDTAPFSRNIQLFDSHVFAKTPPEIVFDAQAQTITQIFKIKPKPVAINHPLAFRNNVPTPQPPSHNGQW